ncbi:MAG TPA: glycosyltransferase family 4 protein [Kouleothrix sp.]|nr:glycosyltransferase family 4 protein [Kouleothrix sp.]
MADVLLTVSGSIAPDTAEQIAKGMRPRADYLELARAFNADVIDYAAARRASGRIGRLLERLGGSDVVLAWACFRKRHIYKAIFTDGEQVGIPLALMERFFGLGMRRARHLMIVHILSVKKKMLFFDYLGLQRRIDRFLVYSTWQKQFIEQRWSVTPERVVFTPFMVDTHFFSPEHATPQPGNTPIICSVGLEARDYPTLLRAVENLPAQIMIAAASPWSKRTDNTQGQHIPANVTVRRFSQYDLRQLYADSAFMVMPLQNVEFQAGVTAILEAMAMGRAVICSRTPGQTDVVVDGETGIYVPPGDPAALREAIDYLLAHPDIALRMGQAGRRRIEQSMNLDLYVERLAKLVHLEARQHA